MDITGKWEGYYKYDDPQLQAVTGHAWTNFEITIHFFDGTRFEGRVTDDPATGGTPGIGKITGKIKKNKVTFRKLMPVRTLIMPDGTQAIREGAHYLLYYSGIILDGEKEWKGHWKFKKQWGFLWGFLPLLYSLGTGFWGMKKVD